MANLTQFGKNNLLWRRAQRHTQMSAIFAPPGQTAVSTPAPPAATWDSIEPLIQPRPTMAGENLPQSASIQPVFPDTAATSPQGQAVSTAANIPVAAAKPPPVATHVGNLTSHAVDEDEDKNWRRLQTIRRRYQQKKVAEQMPQSSSEPIQRQKMDESVVPKPSLPSHAAERVYPPEDVGAIMPESTGESAPQLHAAPLETAWSVQKKESSPTAAEQRSMKQPTVQPQSLPPEQAQQIDHNLAQVAPGRATESPIETILPTRPRPQTATPLAVQRQKVKKAALPDSPMPMPTQKDNTPSSTPLIQTEIGPLPADLWETLGVASPQPPSEETSSFTAPPSLSKTVPDLQKTAVSQPKSNPPQPAPQLEEPVAQVTAVPTGSNLPAKISSENVQTTVSVPPSPPIAQMLMAKPTSHVPQPSSLEGENWETAVSQPKATPSQQADPHSVQAAPSQITAVPTGSNLPAKISSENVQTTVSQPFPPTKAHTTTIQRFPESPSAVQGVIEMGETAETAVTQPTMQLTAKPIQRTAETAITTIAAPPLPQTASKTVRNAKAGQPVSNKRNIGDLDVAQPTVQPPKVEAKPAESERMIQRFPAMPSAMPEGVASAVQDVAAQGVGVMETAVTAPAALLQEAEQAIETVIHPQKEEIDIDDLSRQVYQALKQKLAVEWERGYGR